MMERLRPTQSSFDVSAALQNEHNTLIDTFFLIEYCLVAWVRCNQNGLDKNRFIAISVDIYHPSRSSLILS